MQWYWTSLKTHAFGFFSLITVLVPFTVSAEEIILPKHDLSVTLQNTHSGLFMGVDRGLWITSVSVVQREAGATDTVWTLVSAVDPNHMFLQNKKSGLFLGIDDEGNAILTPGPDIAFAISQSGSPSGKSFYFKPVGTDDPNEVLAVGGSAAGLGDPVKLVSNFSLGRWVMDYEASHIVGSAVSKTNGRVYTWYANGQYTVGSNQDLDLFQPPTNYILPPGKSPLDVVGVALASNDRAVAWFADQSFSDGTPSNITNTPAPSFYSLPQNRTVGDIVGIAFDSNDKVVVFYLDSERGTQSKQKLWVAKNNNERQLSIRPNRTKLPSNHNFPPFYSTFISGVGIEPDRNDVQVWFKDGITTTGSIENVGRFGTPQNYSMPDWLSRRVTDPGPISPMVADVEVVSVSVEPPAIQPGREVVINTEIQNSGTVLAGQEATSTEWVLKQGDEKISDVGIITGGSIGELGPGQQRHLSLIFEVPDILPGEYSLCATIDFKNELPEFNENNNERCGAITIAKGPDLVAIKQLIGIPTFRPRENMSMMFFIRNNGDLTASFSEAPVPSPIHAHLSIFSNSVANFPERKHEVRDVNYEISPGAIKQVYYTIPFAPHQEGKYRACHIVDPYDFVEEVIENNNQVCITFRVRNN